MYLRETENALHLGKMNQLGHLDRLFDVAEERVQAGEDNVDIAVFNTYEDGNYAVLHPDTEAVAYLVPPRIFHGYVEMRYVTMGNVSAYIPGQKYSLGEYLAIAKRITGEGLTGAEDDELYCDWIAKKNTGLQRAVILQSGYRITDEQGDTNPILTWGVMKFSPNERESN